MDGSGNQEESFQSVGYDGVTRKLSDVSLRWPQSSAYPDFWGHQEVMIKCDQVQSMKRIAELLQERRRPRRTIVEYSPKKSHQSNGMVETHTTIWKGCCAPCVPISEKTSVNVNVKSLLTPWLVRHCAWSFDTVCHWYWRANSFQATT